MISHLRPLDPSETASGHVLFAYSCAMNEYGKRPIIKLGDVKWAQFVDEIGFDGWDKIFDMEIVWHDIVVLRMAAPGVEASFE
jgi:hypothetical protein